MEPPIHKRPHPYPRQFLIPNHKPHQKSNLYTFNPGSSTYSSIHKQSLVHKQTNPQETNENAMGCKIYYDAETKHEQEAPNYKLIVNSQVQQNQQNTQNFNVLGKQLKGPRHEETANSRYQDNMEITKLSRLAQSGFIVRQSKVYQQQNKKQGRVQKQFNRLGLSLIGVKRSKYNKTCLEKKTSFSISQRSSPKQSKHTNENRYSNNKKDEDQIYQHSFYPFKAKLIQNLKQQINRISGESRVRKDTQKNQLQQYLQQNLNNSNSKYKQQFTQLEQHNRHITNINIKTSISVLKQLLLCSLKKKQLRIQIPKFFTHPPSQLTKTDSIDTEMLNNQCIHIFNSLNIPVSTLNIRKYSNCIVIINKHVGIVWHEGGEGKKYIGEWKNKYFDEGEKEGLGLEWAPGRYVYYGQFKQNKRHGFGLMRRNDASIKLGYWKSGKYYQHGIQKNG